VRRTVESGDVGAIKDLNVEIYRDTWERLPKFCKEQPVTVHNYPDVLPVNQRRGETPCEVAVWNMDCLEAVQQLSAKHPGCRIGLMNPANQVHPGGGVTKGARALDEDLHRRTTLAAASELGGINNGGGELARFPIPERGCTRVDNVYALKDREYQLLEAPFSFSVVNVAALNQPPLTPDRQHMQPPYLRLSLERIRSALAALIDGGIRHAVLVALGCGAFENPPHDIARLFRIALQEYRFHFDAVVFAVIEDHNSRNANVAAFSAEFSVPLTEFACNELNCTDYYHSVFFGWPELADRADYWQWFNWREKRWRRYTDEQSQRLEAGYRRWYEDINKPDRVALEIPGYDFCVLFSAMRQIGGRGPAAAVQRVRAQSE
jgi:hypothetical protein